MIVKKDLNIVTMDDNKFDSILRTKLQDYHHPAIHPGALDELHQQTSANASTSWHKRHYTELVIGSGIALGIIIFLLGYMLFIRTTRLIQDQSNTINDQKAQLEKLRVEVSALQNTNRDTIRIIQSHGASYTSNTQLLQRIARLEEENQELIEASRKNNDRQIYAAVDGRLRYTPPLEYSRHSALRYMEPYDHITLKNEKAHVSRQVSLSPTTLRALERHYSAGVGIKLGPTADVFGGHYSLGKGHMNLGGGVLADFIVSPSLGIETGVRYSERYYAVHDDEVLLNSGLPGTDSQLGELQGAEVDYRLLEIPFHLKYRYPLSLRDHFIAGIGYSCLIYLNQDFEYTYEFDNQSSNPTSIVSTVTSDEVKVYPGTVNITLGMSRMLKNKKIIEASLFYNHGIGTQGLEATRAQFFGLRGTYWFTVK